MLVRAYEILNKTKWAPVPLKVVVLACLPGPSQSSPWLSSWKGRGLSAIPVCQTQTLIGIFLGFPYVWTFARKIVFVDPQLCEVGHFLCSKLKINAEFLSSSSNSRLSAIFYRVTMNPGKHSLKFKQMPNSYFAWFHKTKGSTHTHVHTLSLNFKDIQVIHW